METYTGVVDATADAFDLLLSPAWWPEAACRRLTDEQLYVRDRFTDDGEWTTIFHSAHPSHLAQAKAVCMSCDFQAECLLRVLPLETLFFGTVGGLNARERRDFSHMVTVMGLLGPTLRPHGTLGRSAQCECSLCSPVRAEQTRQESARSGMSYLQSSDGGDCAPGWSQDMIPMKGDAAA